MQDDGRTPRRRRSDHDRLPHPQKLPRHRRHVRRPRDLIDFSTGVPAVQVGAVPQAAIAGMSSPTPSIAPASTLAPESPAPAMPYAAATAGMAMYERHGSSDPLEFDTTWGKVEEMWQQATTGQRVLVGALGLFILYLVFHAFYSFSTPSNGFPRPVYLHPAHAPPVRQRAAARNRRSSVTAPCPRICFTSSPSICDRASVPMPTG